MNLGRANCVNRVLDRQSGAPTNEKTRSPRAVSQSKSAPGAPRKTESQIEASTTVAGSWRTIAATRWSAEAIWQEVTICLV
jgi:hypothetical protein